MAESKTTLDECLGDRILRQMKERKVAAVLRACNGVLADAKASLDFADQVLVSRTMIGELRQAVRECMNV